MGQRRSWMPALLPSPRGHAATSTGGGSLAIFRRSPRMDAAWKLVEFLSRPPVQQEFYRLSGNLPARRSAWAAPALANDPYARAFRDQLDRVRPLPQAPECERSATELPLLIEIVVR